MSLTHVQFLAPSTALISFSMRGMKLWSFSLGFLYTVWTRYEAIQALLKVAGSGPDQSPPALKGFVALDPVRNQAFVSCKATILMGHVRSWGRHRYCMWPCRSATAELGAINAGIIPHCAQQGQITGKRPV